MRELTPRVPTPLPLFGEEWPLERINRDIERTFDCWLRDVDHGLEEFWAPSLIPDWMPLMTLEPGPATAMTEDEKEIMITAELPGLEKEDLAVEIEGNRLTIHGEKKDELKEHKPGYRVDESRYGAFRRTFVLPCEVKAEAIKAEYKNGELRIHLPKTEEAKAKRIEVQVA